MTYVAQRLTERAFGIIPDAAEVAATQSSTRFMLICLQWLHLILVFLNPNYLVSSFSLFLIPPQCLLVKEKMQSYVSDCFGLEP